MPAQARRSRRTGAGDLGTRERILRSALEVFGSHGFDGARTRDIAEAAGANLGLLQYYFGGKEKLWRAAVDHVFEGLWAALAPLAGRDAADPVVRAEMIRTAVRFAAAHPALIRLMNDEGKRDGPRLRWLVDRHGRRLFQTIAAVVAGARRGDALAGVDAVHLYYLVVGSAGLVFSQAAECRRLTGKDPTASPEMVEAHAEMLVRLLAGPV
jgi:AcrR family transcriptional regulator